MRGKLLFITGGLVGYVLGARAGRKRYDQIAAAASDLWNAKPVQRRVTEARDFALEAVGDVPSQLFEAGKKAYSAFQDKAMQDKSQRKAGRSSATTSAARTAAAEKVAKADEKVAQAAAKVSTKSRQAKPATASPSATAPTAASASDFTESTDI